MRQKNKIDLFGRNHIYEKINLDETFPEYLKNNIKKFEKFIL